MFKRPAEIWSGFLFITVATPRYLCPTAPFLYKFHSFVWAYAPFVYKFTQDAFGGKLLYSWHSTLHDIAS